MQNWRKLDNNNDNNIDNNIDNTEETVLQKWGELKKLGEKLEKWGNNNGNNKDKSRNCEANLTKTGEGL